jgi:superfamily I DNA/RNA helicase
MPLNEEKASIIAEPNQNKLICALPGSGKTYLSIRLADAILTDPNTKLLMVTFTNAAAREMQDRATALLGKEKSRRLHTKTFAKIMIAQHKPLLNGRRLIMAGEYDNYILRVVKKLKIDVENVSIVAQQIEEIGRDIHWQPKNDLASKAYIEIQNMMAMYSRIDLTTLAKELVIGLQAGDIAPLDYTSYVVDEFQDTDTIQYLWLSAHNMPTKSFCVVGDDDQSIYSWRGARGYNNMVAFQRDFKATAYLMSTCYRCAPLILGLAQQLIEHGADRIIKDMSSGIEEPGKVSARVFPSDYISPFTAVLESRPKALSQSLPPPTADNKDIEAYRFIVDQIQDDYQTWAILCRTNKHLDTLEYALAERGIPAVRLGGKSIFDTPHAIGIAKLLVGVIFPKAHNQLVDGLGWAGEDEGIIQSMFYSLHGGGLDAQGVNLKWLDITTDLHSYCRKWQGKGVDVASTDEQLMDFFTVLDRHHAATDAQDIKYREAIARSLKSMLLSMNGPVTERAKKLYKLATNTTKEKPSHKHPGKVVLCTLTGSKGLEWPKVFIMMINRQIIPSSKDDSEDNKDEERRLLYVGITRAERELVLHWHKSRPSCFIEELGLN